MANHAKDHLITTYAFTKTTHTEVYASLDPTAPKLSQSGKVVIITGANRGLGRRAFPIAFAKANVKGIVLVARNAAPLDDVEKEIHEVNPRVYVLKAQADSTDNVAINKVFQSIKSTFGHADILVNNAGAFTSKNRIVDATPSEWWADFETNVKGTALVTRAFAQLLGDRPGTVVSLTSFATLGIFPGISSYALSKLMVVQLGSYLAAENPNITAVSLDPLIAATDMLLDVYKPLQQISFGLIGAAAVWLTTDEAKFMNGRFFMADWSVDELIARKDEITRENKLTFGFIGQLGKDQFDN